MERLAVYRSELENRIGKRVFLALPREEIDRLSGAVTMVTVDDSLPTAGAPLLLLGTTILLHRNYTWLTFASDGSGLASTRALSLTGSADAASHSGIFLEEGRHDVVHRSLDGLLEPHAFELRLAGLLLEHLAVPGSHWLRLVYVARLNGSFAESCRGALAHGVPMGTGELRQRRHEFDAVGRVLIDNLPAF